MKTMIQGKIFPVAILLALLPAVHAPANPPAEVDPNFVAFFRVRIEELVAGRKVPSMAVALARSGEILWEEGFGWADREKGIPATEHTPYALASLSKPFTATAVMILQERGLIRLDSPINHYLGTAKLRARVGGADQATVRRVAGHTSGLPLHARHFCDGRPHPLPAMDETIRCYGNLVTAPGERYQYSNLGYGLLGHVISRVSGKRYAAFLQEEVFAPLGLDHTSVRTGRGRGEARAVKYTPGGLVVPPCDTDSPGASAICSSAHDLVRFGMFHLKNRLTGQKAILTESAIDAMQQPSPETGPTRAWERKGSGCGIGWFIGVTDERLRAVYHSGGTAGVSTVLALVPEENIAVAVLSNTHSKWPDAILLEILGRLLPGRLANVPEPTARAAHEPPFSPGPSLAGLWEGFVHACEGEVPMALEIRESGDVYASLGGRSRTRLDDVSYRDHLPQFLNAGGGPFLRGRMPCGLDTPDVNRGRPCTLWLEVKRRGGRLTGSLIAFSQRTIYTGPLSHWVQMRRK